MKSRKKSCSLAEIWIESPIPYYESLDVDFVGSRDACWTDINTGFLYYRPARPVRRFVQRPGITVLLYHLISPALPDNPKHQGKI